MLQIERCFRSSHFQAEIVEEGENTERRVRGVGGKGLGPER